MCRRCELSVARFRQFSVPPLYDERDDNAIQISLPLPPSSLLPPRSGSKTNPFIPRETLRLLETVAARSSRKMCSGWKKRRTERTKATERKRKHDAISTLTENTSSATARAKGRRRKKGRYIAQRSVVASAGGGSGSGYRRRISHSSLFHRSRCLVQQVRFRRNMRVTAFESL